MQKLPASAGWAWIKQGWALFRKQPLDLTTLSLLYFVIMGLLVRLPFVGVFLVFILKPAMSMAFMQANANVEQGKRVYPSALLTGFRKPALPTLLFFGAASLAIAALAVGLSTLIDDGLLWKFLQGKLQIDPQAVDDDTVSMLTNLMLSMLIVTVLYMPVEMALWYAPSLTVWQGMGPGKATFFSFFAVKHAFKPFLVYGLAWFAIVFMLSPLERVLHALLGDFATILFSLVLFTIACCSFYPTYTDVFGKPYSEPEDIEQNPTQ